MITLVKKSEDKFLFFKMSSFYVIGWYVSGGHSILATFWDLLAWLGTLAANSQWVNVAPWKIQERYVYDIWTQISLFF